MKPIGQYPSLAEYKSVGIKPPLHYVIKETKLLVPRAGTDTPLTSAEDALLSDISFMDEVEVEVEVSPDWETPQKMGSSSRFKRAVLNMDNSLLHNDFATPISESFEIFTSHPSSSSPRSRTPVDSLDQKLSTMSTPVLPTADIKPETGFLDTLRSLPLPASSKYNVLRLRAALESAVTHSMNEGNDKAALSLVFFWAEMKLNGDDFKLALIENMGKSQDSGHQLQTILQTILRYSTVGAASWYESFIIEQESLQKGWVSESDKMAAKAANFVEPEASTRKAVVSTAEIYRDTSGPRLEEAFLSGKTNTAPLKRPKKPCPANELPYKRRQTWDADPDTEMQLRIKRARAAEKVLHANTSPEQESFVRGSDPDDLARLGGRPVSPTFSEFSGFSGFSPSLSGLSNSAYSDADVWSGDQPPRMEFEIKDSDDDDDDDNVNSDFCRNCDKDGFMICCENCDNSFHLSCCDPKLDAIPAGAWLCPKCRTHSIFTTLINNPIRPHKTEFSLPVDIKSYFEGVGEGRQYDTNYPTDLKNQSWYKSVPHLPRLTKQPKQKGPTPLYGDPNLTKLVENGHLILCTRCGKSSENIYPIIRCDYCTCRFHLDCLDPPRAIPPNPFDGWMCPNHVDPDGMISRKMVNGQVQERRIRIPKHAASAVLNDPEATLLVDQDDTDIDLEEQNDVILSFIDGVKDKAALRQLEKTLQAEQRLIKAQKALDQQKSEISGIKAQAAFLASICEEQRILAIQKQKLDEAKKFVSDCISSFNPNDTNAHAGLQAQLDVILEGMKLDNIRSMEAAAVDGLLGLSSSSP
ncbi:hypothetical protein N7495_006397 [Penicillium taxi]|uniref:uncharacterized protein n=1 Tax=Penicillium taxi TaxID=168475 RepID=UPI002545A2F6|nr:uncharacterized protein N7495_006397 [Penicillium taxi]KAJ5894706.1 hypothetical protein N7495_006397 [Penicillium taxi]